MASRTARIDRASATIEAPRALVYEAFVDRTAVLHWLPPAGSRARLEAFEPWVGGAFRLTLVFDEAAGGNGHKTSENSDTVDGKFVQLVPPRLVVQEFDFVSDDPRFAGTMTMTWTLDESPAGTVVSVEASNVPPGITADDHRAGLESSLANLSAYVEGRGTL